MSIEEIRPLINLVSPEIGLAINSLMSLTQFFNSSLKRSQDVEIIEKRAYSIVTLLSQIKDHSNTYYQELEIRLHENLLLLEKIKNG